MRYRMRTRIRGSRWLSLVTGAATAAALTLLGTATAQASPAVAHAAAASAGRGARLAARYLRALQRDAEAGRRPLLRDRAHPGRP